MAIYDRAINKIVVRVVYDGAARSGKTTNVRRICDSFTTRKRGELVAPEESDGRTQFFDWLLLDTGLVGGYPMRCQLMTVPGQESLRHRRDLLLAQADVVVFVVDSSPDGMLDASRAHGQLVEVLAERAVEEGIERVPVIVQANKQDLPDAMNVAQVQATLGLPGDTIVAPAAAADNMGVRETLVLAIRAAANRVQRGLLARGVDVFDGASDTVDDLLAAMKAAEEMLRPTAPATAENEVRDLLRWQPSVEDHLDLYEEPEDGIESIEEIEPGDEVLEPAFPHPLVPSGFIWPGTTGRVLLQDVVERPIKARRDLVGAHGGVDGSGTSDIIVYEAGPWFLKTSFRRRFEDVDVARMALLSMARKKVSLGDMLLPHTVLSLRPDSDGSVWLWTVAPFVATLRHEMVSADKQGDVRELGRALARFAAVAVDAMLMASRNGIVLDVHPSNFARAERGTAYIDDDIEEGRALPLIGALLLRRVQEYEHHPRAIETYLEALEEELVSRLVHDDVEQLDLVGEIRDATTRSAATRQAQTRLAQAAQRARSNR